MQLWSGLHRADRRTAVWKKEHQRYLHLWQTEKSALAQHGCSTGRRIYFDDMRMLPNIFSYDTKLTRESLEINREDGTRMSDVWS